MKRTISYTVSSKHDGSTVESFLRAQCYTKQSIVEIKKGENNLIIDGVWVRMNHVLHTGDKLIVNIYEQVTCNDDGQEACDGQKSHSIVPVELPFRVVYEDEDIIVVDKPADMPIHPSRNNFDNTLANAMAYYYQQKGDGFIFRCINRLDRDTSGLVLIAKHYLSAGILQRSMVNREIKREYRALVSGIFAEKSGTVDLPIGRVDDAGIKRFVDLENGERAVTHYQVIEECKPQAVALLGLCLDTGRTHQIRVHMSHIGHPLLGDKLYNPDYSEAGPMTSQALHSYRLSFIHPITKEKLEFISETPWDRV